MARVLLRST